MAENGQEAVEKFKEDDYDVVLMDIQMPVLDGYGATKAIREYERENNLSPTPIIAVTAHAFQENEDLAYEAGWRRLHHQAGPQGPAHRDHRTWGQDGN